MQPLASRGEFAFRSGWHEVIEDGRRVHPCVKTVLGHGPAFLEHHGCARRGKDEGEPWGLGRRGATSDACDIMAMPVEVVRDGPSCPSCAGVHHRTDVIDGRRGRAQRDGDALSVRRLRVDKVAQAGHHADVIGRFPATFLAWSPQHGGALGPDGFDKVLRDRVVGKVVVHAWNHEKRCASGACSGHGHEQRTVLKSVHVGCEGGAGGWSHKHAIDTVELGHVALPAGNDGPVRGPSHGQGGDHVLRGAGHDGQDLGAMTA